MPLLPGVQRVQLRQFADERGFFRETFRSPSYADLGIACAFVQDNHSFSHHNVLRGMHFQRGQAKLITVMSGVIYDVFVDIREESPTFGKWGALYLDAAKGDQLFIPDGYAHGFWVASEEAHVSYKVSALYDPEKEKGFSYCDPEIAIEWPSHNPILSVRDASHPTFRGVLQ